MPRPVERDSCLPHPHTHTHTPTPHAHTTTPTPHTNTHTHQWDGLVVEGQWLSSRAGLECGVEFDPPLHILSKHVPCPHSHLDVLLSLQLSRGVKTHLKPWQHCNHGEIQPLPNMTMTKLCNSLTLLHANSDLTYCCTANYFTATLSIHSCG